MAAAFGFGFGLLRWSDIPARTPVALGAVASRHSGLCGVGFFSGLAPDPLDPDSADGRFRILNEPARGRITVHERAGMTCAGETLSAADGTWHIGNINPDVYYVVIGWDGRALQNAAIQDWLKPAVPE